ncbi:MAG TPA: hypothetical protein VK992_04500 [Candidatus Caenarcaniphilales bacterium]|nr:hypothetical protein [Candidatus Caenarcaniphilales bacterium]
MAYARSLLCRFHFDDEPTIHLPVDRELHLAPWRIPFDHLPLGDVADAAEQSPLVIHLRETGRRADV